MRKLFIVVNEDRFFLSHRKAVAVEALRRGFDVTVVAKDTGRRSEVEAIGARMVDMPINPTGMNPLQELRTFRFLRSLYESERPDIVHHVGLKNILWGGLAAKMLGVGGVVGAVSGLGGLFGDEKLSVVTRGILGVMRFSNNREGVRVIFQNTDDEALFLEHKVVSPHQVEFTKGSGVDLDDFRYAPEPADGPVTVIFTARMVKEKGVCDLIEAAERLKPEFGSRVKFLLCGRLTPNKSGITREYMHEHCDGEYICWLGERNDVRELLEKSHIMAFPSYYREGVPKSLIEASAIGRPIVTCDSTGCRDVVDDGVNGFLIEPRNADMLAERLRRLIMDGELRRKMGHASRLKAEREFSIDKVVETHMNIYESLISGIR